MNPKTADALVARLLRDRVLHLHRVAVTGHGGKRNEQWRLVLQRKGGLYDICGDRDRCLRLVLR